MRTGKHLGSKDAQIIEDERSATQLDQLGAAKKEEKNTNMDWQGLPSLDHDSIVSSSQISVESNPNAREKGSVNSDPECLDLETGEMAYNARPSPTTPNLSIDTEKATAESNVNIENRRKSPLADRSPSWPRQVPSRPLAVGSPVSPRSRDRGFSLRRSLLVRSVHGDAQGHGTVLELQPSASTTRNFPLSSVHSENQPEKKPETTVRISPIVNNVSLTKKPVSKSGLLVSLPNYETWARNKAARSGLFLGLKESFKKLRKIILRIHEIPPSKDGRHLDLDLRHRTPLIDERTGRRYIDNMIRSSKYTLWNFLPRQLFAQFSKLANFYFLCVSILQMIPGLSTTGNYTTIVPLAFFVTISMAKEGYDDFRRYKLDKAENNKLASVLQAYTSTATTTGRNNEPPTADSEPMIWADMAWKNVRVGDVVKLQRNQAAPADLVILNSRGVNGTAYIETMALDGETNLKNKQAPPPLAQSCNNIDGMKECGARFVVEDPNLDLYQFEGRCTVAGETVPLTNSDIIYRGSILRNTPELFGLVIYTGEECKIRMNASKNPRIKAPALQAVVNKVVIIIVLFVIALAIFNTVAYQIWVETTEEKAWYLIDASVAFFPILTSFIILFNTMIPLSLYVSLEIVKLFQLMLMNDIDMYDEDSNTPMEARTSTINEELGQVRYVLIHYFRVGPNLPIAIFSRTKRAH